MLLFEFRFFALLFGISDSMAFEGGKASTGVRLVAARCPRSCVALRIKSSSSAKFWV